ncbi:MAG: TonB-dependent receptor [Pirellulales bacterium]|nr:TonB-dependent receptor [Pirellulales bacterium]
MASPTIPQLPETEVVGELPSAAGEVQDFPPTQPGLSVLEGSLFSSPAAPGYLAPSSTTGTLLNVSDQIIPETVTVVPRDLITDQQAIHFEDVLRDIAGAVKAEDPMRPDAFFLRGLQIRARDYRKNGFFDPTYTPRDFANVERIEVLQGPGSVLYGAGQPSGVVNLITKKPLPIYRHVGGVEIGSFGLQRYTVDTTGPITPTLFYRLNTAYENQDGFRDFGFENRILLAPAVTWLLDDSTKLTWEGEFVHDKQRYDTGVAAIGYDPTVLPIQRFLGEPTDFAEFYDYRQTLMLTRQINDQWAWNIGGYSLFYGGPESGTYPVTYLGPTPLGPTTFLRVRQNVAPWNEQYQSVVANLTGAFETGLWQHHFVIGTEQGWLITDQFRGATSTPLNPMTTLALDATYPYYQNPATGLPDPATPVVFDSTYRENRHGVYVQDFAELGEHWKFLLGVRYDQLDVDFDRSMVPIFPEVNTTQTFEQATPRIGIVYEAYPEMLTYYGVYSESFDSPGGGPRLTTEPLEPELGQMWEGGVKARLLSNLSCTVCGFHINKEHVTVDQYDPVHFIVVTSQVGRVRSQGMEFALIGRVNPEIQMTANWTYVDARNFDETNPSVNEKRVRGVPGHLANVWVRYNFIHEADRTYGMALGMVHVGRRLGDYNSPTELPGYTRWDAGLYYQRSFFDLGLYFENIFNVKYYVGSLDQYQIYPGAPFTARALATCRF